MDLADEHNITDLAMRRWATAKNPRLAKIMPLLIKHLHAFARQSPRCQRSWRGWYDWLDASHGEFGDRRPGAVRRAPYRYAPHTGKDLENCRGGKSMIANAFEYTAPKTLDEALHLIAEGAKPLGGGVTVKLKTSNGSAPVVPAGKRIRARAIWPFGTRVKRWRISADGAPTATVRVTSVVPSRYWAPESTSTSWPGSSLRLVRRVGW